MFIRNCGSLLKYKYEHCMFLYGLLYENACLWVQYVQKATLFIQSPHGVDFVATQQLLANAIKNIEYINSSVLYENMRTCVVSADALCGRYGGGAS